ncbi:minor capsid protein [Corynebacterium sp. TAE3-ERU16]|uniref:minor capsid protein n=1 Tax=Corynebacterium sp. TAE3-ERU16 TaxID=2849493 RepID=UPI001C43B51C|nr:minor capsid protein [Corynebacterium sp. TAE3-ERU16]MBV7292374.1 minor capsid protein [Corynebacterium sp. TAE3-ERU16]
MTAPCAFADHGGADYQLAEYLHSLGLVWDPAEDQAAAVGVPAVYTRLMMDKPDRAVGITVTADERDDDANPRVSLLVVCRSDPWDAAQLDRDAGAIFAALHDRSHYELTAGQGVLLSRRTLQGPPVQDQNRRWQRADTYVLRLLAPKPS